MKQKRRGLWSRIICIFLILVMLPVQAMASAAQEETVSPSEKAERSSVGYPFSWSRPSMVMAWARVMVALGEK